MPFDQGLRTFAYIDGFNLYHRGLQDTCHRWIDPKKLLENVVGAQTPFAQANFYTARVSAKIDPDAPRKQQAYLSALEDIQGIEITYGNFRTEKKWRVLASEVNNFRPRPMVVKVTNPEEKGSDVNLGAHLIRDGFQGKYEQAVVCTNDTDLCEPIRIVVQELNLPVILVSPSSLAPTIPPSTTAASLIQAVGNNAMVYHMHNAHAAGAALPDPYTRQDGKVISMPQTWANPRQRNV